MGVIGEQVYFDGRFISADQEISGQLEKNNSVYEVLRVINSVPIFFEDHFKRLKFSLDSLHTEYNLSDTGLHDILIKLIKINQIKHGNIRIEIFITEKSNVLQISQIQAFYPPEELYQAGVNAKSFQIERENPRVKQSAINTTVRTEIRSVLEDPGIFEVVLVNHLLELTEGSRTNVLFLKDKVIYTAPENEILLGITRKILLSVAMKQGFLIEEGPIKLDTISGFDACFFTGTSTKVLPIKQIDDIVFNPKHKELIRLMEGFNTEINSYSKR